MKMNKKAWLIAMAAAMPWLGAHAQSNAELLQQIQALQAQQGNPELSLPPPERASG